ncbi:MAG: glycerol-3-phosphate 1-O-acyltransferase PlsY [Actinomycetes bacterium]
MRPALAASVGSWSLLAAAAVVGYLVGSLSPAALIARARGVDLRHSGSGNPGATNAGRVMGRAVGWLVGVLDVLKGLVPALAFGYWGSTTAAMVAGLAAVVGHCTSPWLRGHGGKGVATSFGAILGVEPWWALAGLAVFALVVLATRWVALGSMAAATTVVVIAFVGWVRDVDELSGRLLLWALALGCIVVLRHRANVVARWRERRPAT